MKGERKGEKKMELLHTWWFNVIIYLVLTVGFSQMYKMATRRSKKDGALITCIQILSSIFILLAIPFYGIKFPTDYTVYLWLLASIVFYAIADRLNATVRRGLEVSTFSIIEQVKTVFIITLGLLFFKEPFVWTKILGAILIVATNVFLLYQKGKFVINKYVILELLACLSISIANFIDIGISEQFNLPIYIALTLMIPAIFIIVLERIKLKEIKEEFMEGNKKAILITSGIWGFMILFFLQAYQYGTVTTVTPIASLSVVFNVIAGYLFLKERNDITKKIIAGILIFISIFLVQM